MNLWRVRCTLPDRPGALAAMARECGAARVNIALRPPLDWDALHAWAQEVIPAFAS